MPAYVVAHVEVTDPIRYQEYRAMVLGTMTPFGGRFLVRGPAPEVLEGSWDPKRLGIGTVAPVGGWFLVGGTAAEVLGGSWDPKPLVILEFPDADHARRWWASPEYAAAKAIRQATSVGTLVLLEGVSPS